MKAEIVRWAWVESPSVGAPIFLRLQWLGHLGAFGVKAGVRKTTPAFHYLWGQNVGTFSIVKWFPFQLSRYKLTGSGGHLFHCQVGTFWVDKNRTIALGGARSTFPPSSACG